MDTVDVSVPYIIQLDAFSITKVVLKAVKKLIRFNGGGIIVWRGKKNTPLRLNSDISMEKRHPGNNKS